jgi:hypothetical protein
MYIRRAALDQVGGFDAEAFGRGYGEENDFCLRATRLGWRHLAAPDTFVRHLGSVSFGEERASLVSQGLAAIEARHPGYQSLISRFIAQDLLADARGWLDAARIQRAGHSGRLVHDRPQAADDDLFLRRIPGRRRGLLIRAPRVPDTPNIPIFDPVVRPGEVREWLDRLGVKAIVLRSPALLGRRIGHALKVPAAMAWARSGTGPTGRYALVKSDARCLRRIDLGLASP